MRIDEERAELRQQIFEARCRRRRGARAAKNGPVIAAEPADRDDDQEIDQMLEGVAGLDREDLGAERAAQRREPAAEREGAR